MSSSPQPERWRLLPFSAEPADQQLAAGDALLRELDLAPADAVLPPALRWYQMSPRALVLGSGQKPHEFDLDACRTATVALHKRSSGGTAVLAEPDQIMQDIVLPAGHRLHRQDVTESYRWLGEVWVAVLAELGITGELLAVDTARADTKTLDALTKRSCYGGRSPYEVLVDGRKVVGLAQVRRRQGVLLQTGIYIRWQPRQLVQMFAMPAAERALLAERLEARVAGLADVLPGSPPPDLFAQVQETFAAVLREQQGVVLEPAPWSSAALEARAQAAARYAALELDS